MRQSEPKPEGRPGEPVARWAWQLLVVVELVNLVDWATTIVGAGMLGLPERGSATAYLMRWLGVAGGATVVKAAAAVVFVVFATSAARIAARRGRGAEAAAAGLLWGLAYAGLLLAQTVLWNLVSIWQAVRP